LSIRYITTEPTESGKHFTPQWLFCLTINRAAKELVCVCVCVCVCVYGRMPPQLCLNDRKLEEIWEEATKRGKLHIDTICENLVLATYLWINSVYTCVCVHVHIHQCWQSWRQGNELTLDQLWEVAILLYEVTLNIFMYANTKK
jgi:hypothetical protein